MKECLTYLNIRPVTTFLDLITSNLDSYKYISCAVQPKDASGTNIGRKRASAPSKKVMANNLISAEIDRQKMVAADKKGANRARKGKEEVARKRLDTMGLNRGLAKKVKRVR